MELLNKIVERPKLIFGAAISRQINFYKIVPELATLFLTFRCNSQCATCTAWLRDKEEELLKEISLDQWKKIVDKLAKNGIKSVELFGGNILLRKEVLLPLITYLKKYGFKIYIPTNQIGLDTKTIEALVDAEVDILYISTDGIGEYQDKIRGFKGASNLTNQIVQEIRQYRDKLNKKKPELVCNTTVSKFNVDIIDQMPEYAIDMGFDSIHFEYVGEIDDKLISASMIDGLKPNPMYVKKKNQSVLISAQEAKILKDKLKKIKSKYQNSPIHIGTINIDVLSEEDLYKGTIPHKKCYVERNEVTVDPYGNIAACPFIYNYYYGNLLTDDFESIWNNSRHKRFRELQNSGKLPMCRHCILGVSRNPSFWLSLKRNFIENGYNALLRYMSKNGKNNEITKKKNIQC